MSCISSLGFIGGGKYAQYVARALLSAGTVKANQVAASSRTQKDLNQFRAMGCTVTNDNKLIMKESNFVFLATPASALPNVFKDISPAVTKNHLLTSIAAGVTLDYMQNSLPEQSKVVRMMLNSAVQIGEGVTTVTFGKFTRDEDRTLVHQLMSSVGYCHTVEERLMDLITALTGGGPAYVYLALDALADGAVREGLTREEAVRLVAHTASGAAKMVLKSQKHLAELKDGVCTAGGSTIAGINALEECGVRGALMKAVHVAIERAKELRTDV